MQRDDKKEQVKKPYERPEIRRFPLRPEEAVLGFCKTSGVSQPAGIGCSSVGACRIIGS